MIRLEPTAWDNTADFKKVVAQTTAKFRLARQEDQPVRLWLLTEASGMGSDAIAGGRRLRRPGTIQRWL